GRQGPAEAEARQFHQQSHSALSQAEPTTIIAKTYEIMNAAHSDALVFFGATGDLAYKKIFPALQAMVKRGNLNVPVIGVANGGWTLERLQGRVADSLEKHGGVDSAACAKLQGLLRYVDGNYEDMGTFQALRKALDGAKRPTH